MQLVALIASYGAWSWIVAGIVLLGLERLRRVGNLRGRDYPPPCHAMWVYTLNGENFGPVSEAELDARVASGALTTSGNVWREGMENWVTLDQLRAPAPWAAPGAPG